MDTKHTPGPWVFSESWGAIVAGHPHEPERLITPIWKDSAIAWGGEENNANARLIAAAPDLLAACEEIIEHGTDDWDARLNTIRAAIAKAKGK